MKEKIKLILSLVLLSITLMFIGAGIYKDFSPHFIPESAPMVVNPQLPYIHLDQSARTGFITSPDYDARFEAVDYPVAGSEELLTVYLVDVYKYPSREPVTYHVDSWEEAVEVIEGLGKLNKEFP